jgi:predicted nucleic acid-binding protein
MLHFDTNALIALPVWVKQNHPVVQHIERGGACAVCALVWYEFLCGPVSESHKALAFAVLEARIEPVSEQAATLAAHMFNDSGRARRLRTDALIAACAIVAHAEFATLNQADFLPFVTHGLRLHLQ